MSTSIAIIDQPVAKDIAEDVHLVALNPAEMNASQQSLSTWFYNKAEILKRDAEELELTVATAKQTGFKSPGAIERQAKLTRRRVEFYEKCKAAVDAGYCLVPNFPVQAFVIRTTRKTPDKMEGSRSWDSRDQKSNSPALGIGEHKDASPVQSSYEYEDVDHQGKDVTKQAFYASDFQDEIDFPISVARPEIMTATAEAMALKCFDEIGVLPKRTIVRRDPIVVGIIRDPRTAKYNERFLTFLIAWTVDTKDL